MVSKEAWNRALEQEQEFCKVVQERFPDLQVTVTENYYHEGVFHVYVASHHWGILISEQMPWIDAINKEITNEEINR